MSNVRYKTIVIDGISIFYREAGDPANPTLLLLHGFPSSSHMYRDLLRDLGDRYHLLAPDYPGFGNSDMPPRDEFAYTFDNLSVVMEKFIDALKLTRFAMYLQDYGAPVGYRIAVRRPELIRALILQNGNAYEEGLGPAIDDGKRFWANRNVETENAMRGALTLEGTKFQYLHGVENPSKISPDAYLYDQHFLDRPGNAAIQLDLLYDYRNNLKQYPAWHRYLREHRPPALIAWGKNDPFFTEKGALAYLRDLPDAELHLLNTGHFALEEFHEEIADYIDAFLKKLA
jgi:pimeloyl-ACP methyl ester carboxylesterase